MPDLAVMLRALALALLCLPAAAAAGELGFVYVESNVGGASGGHFALRTGDRVYAYQASDDGSLVLERQPWARFREHYATFGNRPVHIARVRLPGRELARARDAFASAWLAQGRAEAGLQALRDDVAVLEAALGLRAGWDAPGAGLLDARMPGSDALLQRLEKHRAGELARQIGRAEQELRGTSLVTADLTRYRERLTAHAALVALRDAHGLASAALVHDDRALRPSERASLAAQRSRLERQVLELVSSTRPDRGRALFIAEARHAALERSLATDQLVLLDPLLDGRAALYADEVAEHRAELGAIARALDAAQRARRAADLAAGERGLQRLEQRLARRAEYRRAFETGAAVRAFAEGRAASRRGRLPLISARAAPASLARRLEEARAAEGERSSAYQRAHRYELLGNNCATALVSTLNAALGGRERAAALLGRSLEPGARLGFIPAALFAEVRELPGARVERIAAYRETRLRALPADERWREAFTLTSRIYRPRPRDTAFLFFTDDVRWRRPLYGLANLGYGLATGVIGVATAPLDGGRRTASGLMGALFSLPELAGFNVRKGSFDAASVERVE